MLQAVVLASSAQLLRQITGEFMTLIKGWQRHTGIFVDLSTGTISMEWGTDSAVKRPPELWLRSRGRGQECTRHMAAGQSLLGKYFAENWVELCGEDQLCSGDENIERGGLLPIRSANARKTSTGNEDCEEDD